MKKRVAVDSLARKELDEIPKPVRVDFEALMILLSKHGMLKEPEAKKMGGYKNLFEIRVRNEGQWRGLYAYIKGDVIIVLHFFRKKTQKTDRRDLDTALKRLKQWE